MLKIKMIMAALLAISFASPTFASDEVDASQPPVKKQRTGKVNAKTGPKPQKWSAADCVEKCTKAHCKGLEAGSEDSATPTAAQAKNGLKRAFDCAENCKAPGKARAMGDCLPGVYKAQGCMGNKRDDTCKKLSNGMSAIVMDGYENRDNSNDAPAQAFWGAVKSFDVVTN